MKHLLILLTIISFLQISYGQNWESYSTSDDYDPGLFGYYHTLNEFSPKNCPGFKEAYLTWDTEESIFVYESISDYGIFSDNLEEVKVMLWEFNKELMQWRCVQDKMADAFSLGIKGVEDESNFPGYRLSSLTWTDLENNLWLYSGQDNFEEPFYLDLWKFDTTSKKWTYMSGGVSEIGFRGNYEQIGVPSNTAYPSYYGANPNYRGVSFVDRNGDLIMFRGAGSNDMWRYNILNNEWEWLIGEDPVNSISVYGYPSPRPTARDKGIFWTDDQNNYFFLDENTYRQTYQIWKFDTDTIGWSIEYLDNTSRINIDLFREESAENIMFRFKNPNLWNLNNEYLWFFGIGRNIMARLNLKTYEWAWFNGTTKVNDEYPDSSEIFNGPGFGFKKGEERTINLPIAKDRAITWEKNGRLYIAYGNGGYSYDIWSYNPINYNFIFEKGRQNSATSSTLSYQHNRIDTTIYYPVPYDDSYDVGVFEHNGLIYQFDEADNLYRRNIKNGINELLRRKQPSNPGTINIASEEVYPPSFKILGVVENEVYGYSRSFKQRIFKYNIQTNLFTCIQEVDDFSTGQLAEFNEFNFPRMYQDHFESWVDQNQKINLFFNNQIWRFDPEINQWAIFSSLPYYSQFIPDFYHRTSKFNSWIDNDSNLWVFNYSMWKYDVSKDLWKLVKHGMPEVNTSYYGDQSRFSIFNNPSARMKFINWVDTKGRLWMAHGRAIYERTNSDWAGDDQRVFHDIWMFDPLVENWVWISGQKDPINRNDPFFNDYSLEEPVMNVNPLSTSDDYLFHNTFEYTEGTILNVIENCDGSIWKMDYKNLTPNYNVLYGAAFYDNENDGCDSLDNAFVNLNVSVNDFDAYTFTDSLGEYAMFCNETSCNFKAKYEPDYFTIIPQDTFIDFSGYGETKNLNYCISPNGLINDLEVLMIPLDQPVSGFNSKYKILCNNKGTTSISGSLKLSYNKMEVNLIEFDIDTIGPANFVTIDTLEWILSDLEPFESKVINVEFRIRPTTMSGDTINYNLETCLDSLTVDYTPEDNTFILSEEIVASFDPNDKRILEGNLLPLHLIDNYIHYRIRFENLGTANARFVYLEDYINEEHFDVSSLIPVSASHSYVARIEEGNKLFVMFNDINLPFDPEDGNKGYFTFKIKTNKNLNSGDFISNYAKIYFDYNEPILTEESVAMFEIIDSDSDGFPVGEDCDDNNPNINPEQLEVPYNGLDDDCNSATLDDDLDQDGFLITNDCDDTNSEINPEAVEIANNGIDEDCDGMDFISSFYEIGNSSIHIYPNPVYEYINIDITGQLDFKVEIYSMDGVNLGSYKNESKIDVRFLSNGTYLLKISDINSSNSIVEKIIISK